MPRKKAPANPKNNAVRMGVLAPYAFASRSARGVIPKMSAGPDFCLEIITIG